MILKSKNSSKNKCCKFEYMKKQNKYTLNLNGTKDVIKFKNGKNKLKYLRVIESH